MALRRLREHTVGGFVPIKEATKPNLPPDHLAAMEVPQGGSMCKNCEYLKDAAKRICRAPNFIAWEGPNKPAGSAKIPLPIDRYCSDWYEPKKGAL